MARAKRYSAEQIGAKLREHEKLQGQGLTIPQACKRIGISDQTFYRWRTKYGALKEDEAQRLKALQRENARLRRSSPSRRWISLVFHRGTGGRRRGVGPTFIGR